MSLQPETDSESQPLSLLLIEDSPDDEFLLLRLLKRANFIVTHRRVQDAESVREALQQQDWDIVISDYSMPQFSGLEALRLVTASGKDIPFIMVSGALGEERAVEVMRSGAGDYVMKDNMARLIPAIQRELRDAESRREGRRAEQQLRKLYKAIDQSASLVLIADRQGIIEYANQTYFKTMGLAVENVIGQNWISIQSVVANAEIFQDIRTSLLSGSEWRGEILIHDVNRREIWTIASVTPIRDEQGEITQFIIVQDDITARKYLEAELKNYTERLELMVSERTEQLQHAKEQLEVILSNTSDAIVLALSSGDIQAVNPAFKELFNQRVQHSVEEIIHLLHTPRDVEEISRALVNVLHDKKEYRVQASIVQQDGTTVDVDLVFTPVEVSSDSEYGGVVINIRDITPFKEIERFKARFVANAAHDLSNPITTLKTQLYLLKHKPEQMNQYIGVLEKETSRLESLVSELRTLAQIDRGEIYLDRREFELNSLVSDVIQAHQAVAMKRQQILTFTAREETMIVFADRAKCERVIANLVSNALTYTPENGAIYVETFLQDGYAGVHVRDTGIGIPSDDLAHIFERFYRTEAGKQASSTGTGLGLAIVKEMIEAHRGYVSVSSVPNAGTTFSIFLPL